MEKNGDQMIIFLLALFFWFLILAFVVSILTFLSKPPEKYPNYKDFSRCCKKLVCDCRHENNPEYAIYYKK